MNRSSVLTWSIFVALSGIWGASFLFIKIALGALGPLSVVALRLTLGAILVWTLVLSQRVPLRSIPWRAMFLMGLINNAMPFTLITWGEQYIPSGLASLVNGSMPIWAALLSHVFLQEERLNRRQWGGVFIGFLGLAVLFLPDIVHATRGWQTWQWVWGQVAVTLAAVGYGLGTVYARRNLRGYHPFLMAATQLTAAALILWPLVILAGETISPTGWHAAEWLAIGWLGFASSGLAYILYYTLIRRMGATQLSLVTYAIPIVGLLLGTWVLDERVGWNALVALGLIIGGIVVVNKARA